MTKYLSMMHLRQDKWSNGSIYSLVTVAELTENPNYSHNNILAHFLN